MVTSDWHLLAIGFRSDHFTFSTDYGFDCPPPRYVIFHQIRSSPYNDNFNFDCQTTECDKCQQLSSIRHLITTATKQPATPKSQAPFCMTHVRQLPPN